MKTATIGPEDIWENGALRRDVFLLDVRSPAEFRDVHIPGSTNVPLGDVRERLPDIRSGAEHRRVAIVCHTWMRSKVVHDALAKAGLADLHVLKGGVDSWARAGLPVLRGSGEAGMSLERQVRIAAGSLVLLGVVLGVWVSAWFLVLPAFVGAGLAYAGLTDTCGFATLLAKLPYNRG